MSLCTCHIGIVMCCIEIFSHYDVTSNSQDAHGILIFLTVILSFQFCMMQFQCQQNAMQSWNYNCNWNSSYEDTCTDHSILLGSCFSVNTIGIAKYTIGVYLVGLKSQMTMHASHFEGTHVYITCMHVYTKTRTTNHVVVNASSQLLTPGIHNIAEVLCESKSATLWINVCHLMVYFLGNSSCGAACPCVAHCISQLQAWLPLQSIVHGPLDSTLLLPSACIHQKCRYHFCASLTWWLKPKLIYSA